MNEREMISHIKSLCRKAGSQKAFAASLGISEQYLSEIIRGKRGMSDNVLTKLGFEKVILYAASKEPEPTGACLHCNGRTIQVRPGKWQCGGCGR